MQLDFQQASIHTSPIRTDSMVQYSLNRMSNSRTSRRDENLACKLSRNHYHLGGRGLLLAATARALLALALGAAASLRAALALASFAGGSATAAFGGHD